MRWYAIDYFIEIFFFCINVALVYCLCDGESYLISKKKKFF